MENKNQNTQVAVTTIKDSRDKIIKQLEQFQAAKFVKLPEDFKEGVFFALEKISSLEEIEKVPAHSVTKALLNVFRNKLDYRKNHCYFFVQNDKTSETGKSLRFGWQYQGLVWVSKDQCGVISNPLPVLVYENDTFETHFEHGALIIDKHIPTFEGNIKGGYCVVEFNGGFRLIRYFTKAQMDQRRNNSKQPNGKFWEWEREMYEKTLINATLKKIIETSSELDAEGLYDEPDPSKLLREANDAEIIPQGDNFQNYQPEPKKVQI